MGKKKKKKEKKMGQSGFKTIGNRNIHKLHTQSFKPFLFLNPAWNITKTGYIPVHKAKFNILQILSNRKIIGNNPEVPFHNRLNNESMVYLYTQQ